MCLKPSTNIETGQFAQSWSRYLKTLRRVCYLLETVHKLAICLTKWKTFKSITQPGRWKTIALIKDRCNVYHVRHSDLLTEFNQRNLFFLLYYLF